MIDLKPNKIVLGTLLSVYSIMAIVLAFNPLERTTWLVENITVWIVLLVLIFLYFKKIRFSTFAYILMFAFLSLHTIGGHYTFANVPFDFITKLFGASRNHFDRVVHFIVGFFAFPIMEWIIAKNNVRNKFILITYPIFTITAVALTYELVEWIYAEKSAPELGMAYLGSQGDIWDAQKDMSCDTLGAVFATTLCYLKYKTKVNKIDI